MLWNSARHDALDPRYDGPYEVLDKKGPDVKIRIRKQARNNRGSRIRDREKWVHLDRCKVYSGNSPVVVNYPLNNGHDDDSDQPDGLILNEENQDPGTQSEQNRMLGWIRGMDSVREKRQQQIRRKRKFPQLGGDIP